MDNNNINIKDCYFYHTMELPNYGVVEGEWDLRENISRYLGNVNFKNKNVLDVGCANGFLSFEMENMGAKVTSYDLSPIENWDIVPHHNINYNQEILIRKKHIEKINNGFYTFPFFLYPLHC